MPGHHCISLAVLWPAAAQPRHSTLLPPGFYVLLDNHIREDQTLLRDPAAWARQWAALVRTVCFHTLCPCVQLRVDDGAAGGRAILSRRVWSAGV